MWLLVGLAAQTAAAESPPDCMVQPMLFDWQALDERNLIVWPAPDAGAYQITLAHIIEGLTAEPAGQLGLIDGDQDGYICSEGLDSAALWSNDAGEGTDVSVPSGEAEIYTVARLDDRAVAELLNTYEKTRGPRNYGRNVDD